MNIKAYLLCILLMSGTLSASWQRWLPKPLSEYFPNQPKPELPLDQILKMNELDKVMQYIDEREKDDEDALAQYLNAWGRLMAEKEHLPTKKTPIRYIEELKEPVPKPFSTPREVPRREAPRSKWALENYTAWPQFLKYGWRPYSSPLPGEQAETPIDSHAILNSFAEYGKTPLDQDAEILERLVEQRKYTDPYLYKNWHEPTKNPKYRTLRDLYRDAYRAKMPEMRAAATLLSELKDAAYRNYLDEQAHASHEGTV